MYSARNGGCRSAAVYRRYLLLVELSFVLTEEEDAAPMAFTVRYLLPVKPSVDVDADGVYRRDPLQLSSSRLRLRTTGLYVVTLAEVREMNERD